jgi:myo-inositol-1(or 4)-monophosphatase
MKIPNQTQSEFTIVALRAALQAGELLKRGFGTTFQVGSKSNKNDLVTEYDRTSEASIMETILTAFPSHGFMGEEGGKKKSGEVMWIVDPLDGTSNFASNVPIFSISIAAAVGPEVVCGVVFQPMTQELFMAEKGKGSFLNGKLLKVRTTTALESAFLATGFPSNVQENPLSCIETFTRLARLGPQIRRLGSAAIDLSYVAAGRFDGYWEASLQPWDFAAGKLILEEAGGKITQYDGSPLDIFSATPVVASNGHLHAQLLRELQR